MLEKIDMWIYYTIEEKDKRIAELNAQIIAIQNEPTRPYDLVRITFDGHGLSSRKRTEVLIINKYKNELVTKCDEIYGEFPIDIPDKAKDRKYKTIYHIQRHF